MFVYTGFLLCLKTCSLVTFHPNVLTLIKAGNSHDVILLVIVTMLYQITGAAHIILTNNVSHNMLSQHC